MYSKLTWTTSCCFVVDKEIQKRERRQFTVCLFVFDHWTSSWRSSGWKIVTQNSAGGEGSGSAVATCNAVATCQKWIVLLLVMSTQVPSHVTQYTEPLVTSFKSARERPLPGMRVGVRAKRRRSSESLVAKVALVFAGAVHGCCCSVLLNTVAAIAAARGAVSDHVGCRLRALVMIICMLIVAGAAIMHVIVIKTMMLMMVLLLLMMIIHIEVQPQQIARKHDFRVDGGWLHRLGGERRCMRVRLLKKHRCKAIIPCVCVRLFFLFFLFFWFHLIYSLAVTAYLRCCPVHLPRNYFFLNTHQHTGSFSALVVLQYLHWLGASCVPAQIARSQVGGRAGRIQAFIRYKKRKKKGCQEWLLVPNYVFYIRCCLGHDLSYLSYSLTWLVVNKLMRSCGRPMKKTSYMVERPRNLGHVSIMYIHGALFFLSCISHSAYACNMLWYPLFFPSCSSNKRITRNARPQQQQPILTTRATRNKSKVNITDPLHYIYNTIED